MRLKRLTIFLFFLTMACVDTYEIEDTASPNFLVVEGVLSDQFKKHQIFISRTLMLNENKISREEGASVSITVNTGEIISLNELQPGVYETPLFAAEAGRNYTLQITTKDGKVYSSNAVAFNGGPGIENVYAKYIDNPNGPGKGIQVYVDAKNTGVKNNFYRWNYIETYEVHAPYPSNWVWTGGTNLEFRTDGIDTCYVTDTLRNIMLVNTQSQIDPAATAIPIRYIDEELHILRYRYSILVQQFCLSPESYQYWENLRKTSEEQGSLSDLQPGSLKGNLFSVSEPDTEVLGYFDVGSVSEKRIFFSAITFYSEGMKMPQAFRNNCYEIAPVTIMQSELPQLMPSFERTLNIWEVAGLSPNVSVTLFPISCTDCRDQGGTQRPDFF